MSDKENCDGKSNSGSMVTILCLKANYKLLAFLIVILPILATDHIDYGRLEKVSASSTDSSSLAHLANLRSEIKFMSSLNLIALEPLSYFFILIAAN